jgi:hypothetical protein
MCFGSKSLSLRLAFYLILRSYKLLVEVLFFFALIRMIAVMLAPNLA